MWRIICTYSCLLIHFTGFAQLIFNNITSEIGIQHFDVGGNYGSGSTLVDVDGNGFLDLFVLANQDYPNLLYLNNGDNWESPTVIGKESYLSRTAIWLDYNGDSRLDVFILGDCIETDYCNDSETFQLFEQTADRAFVDVSISSELVKNEPILTLLNGYNYSGGLAVGDLNLDGFVDLLVTRWAGELFLFMNNGDGTFTEESERLSQSALNTYFQPLIYDLNGDNIQDILIAMDGDEPNLYFVNNSSQEYVERASEFGLDHRGNDMGIAIGDYDNDSDYDLYISNIEFFNASSGNSFFENQQTQGEFFFTEIASSLGVSNVGWGWGVTFMDANNDGLLDLGATNGWRNHNAYDNDRSRFWLGTGSGFVDRSEEFNFNDTLVATSLISGDFDRDGDLDLIQGLAERDDRNQSIRILRNDALDPSLIGNFLVVKPRMVGNNHWAVGANIIIETNQGHQMRPIISGSSFYGQEPLEAFFGLGTAESIDYVKIVWPGGSETLINNVSANQIITVDDSEVLHAPGFFEYSDIDNESIELRWGHMSTNETHFVLQRSEDSLFSNAVSHYIDKEKKSFFDQDLTLGVDYYYRLRASNGVEYSNWNHFIHVKKYGLENAPLNLISELISPEEVLLRWTDISSTELGFKLRRSTNNEFLHYVEFSLPSNTVFYSDTGLEPNSQYYYRLYSLGMAGISENYVETMIYTAPFGNSPLSLTTEMDVSIYPNPSRGSLQIDSKIPIKGVSCLDVLGQPLSQISVDLSDSQHITLTIPELNTSLLVILYLEDGNMLVRRVVSWE